MKFKYLVVDDEPLARKLIISHTTKIEGLELAGECGNAVEASNFLRLHPVDLVFLDIQMPELDGLQFISALKSPPDTIFTTAFRDFAPEAFDADAVDYLLKPISFERLLKAVHKFFDRRSSVVSKPVMVNTEAEFIYVRAGRKMHKISVAEIAYVESLDDYIKIHLSDKTLVSRENISRLEEKLAPFFFVRIHRSFLVSSRYVTSVSADSVEIRGKLLPFGRAFKLGALASLGIRPNQV